MKLQILQTNRIAKDKPYYLITICNDCIHFERIDEWKCVCNKHGFRAEINGYCDDFSLSNIRSHGDETTD